MNIQNPFHSPIIYILGLNVEAYHGYTVIGHGGCVSGFASHILFVPERNFGIVVLGNSMKTCYVHQKICWSSVDNLIDVPLEKRFDWDMNAERALVEDEKLKTKGELYPNLPETLIPLTFQLEKYAGQYKDDGYGTLVVECRDGRFSFT